MSRRLPRVLAPLPALALVACGTLSIPDEREMGEELNRQVRGEVRLLGDRVVRDYVTAMGRDILRAAGPQPLDYHFDIIVDDEVNAFALPGGHIYLHTGLLLRARDVNELAGVIAHEIGHVVRRHIARNYAKQRAGSVAHQALVLGALIYGGGGAAQAANLAGALAGAAVLNSFSREAEREADDFAVHWLPRAGYDPEGVPSFFEALQREHGGGPPEFLSSHPNSTNRIRATREAIEKQDTSSLGRLRESDGGKLEIIQDRIRLLLGDRF